MTVSAIVALGAGIGVAAGILGAGPSILTVLLLRQAGGLPIGSAIATSLVVVAMMSLVALVPYAASRSILWPSACAFGLASMTGAFLGGRVCAHVPAKVLLVLFLLSVVVAATAMILPRPSQEGGSSCTPGRRALVLGVGGLLVGALTGLVGLGGGFAVVPLLVVFAGAEVRAAVGTSLLVIAMNTLAGLAGHLPHPPIDWRVAAPLGVAESLGSLAGIHFSRRLSAEALRRAFAGLMLIAVAVMLIRALQG